MLLEATHLRKTYRGGVVANDDVSITVDAGEVFGLLGPNGAGKTTLVHQVLGLLVPDSGTITIDGDDVVAQPALSRQRCSFQPQAAAPVEGLSARQAIGLVGRIRGGDRTEVRRRGDELLAALDLMEIADRVVPMSGGMARLTAFCMAAVVPGQVVVLDEPTNDVDPLRRRSLWRLIRGLADDGAAVLLVTHNVLEAERCVDRLAIVGKGKVLASGGAAQLKSEVTARLRLECTLETADPSSLPPQLTLLDVTGRRMSAQLDLDDVGIAVGWAKQQQDEGGIAEFAVVPASLEDVYASWVEPVGATTS